MHITPIIQVIPVISDEIQPIITIENHHVISNETRLIIQKRRLLNIIMERININQSLISEFDDNNIPSVDLTYRIIEPISGVIYTNLYVHMHFNDENHICVNVCLRVFDNKNECVSMHENSFQILICGNMYNDIQNSICNFVTDCII